MTDVGTAMVLAAAGGLLVLKTVTAKPPRSITHPEQDLYLVTGYRNTIGNTLGRLPGANMKIKTPRTSLVKDRNGRPAVKLNTAEAGAPVYHAWGIGKTFRAPR